MTDTNHATALHTASQALRDMAAALKAANTVNDRWRPTSIPERAEYDRLLELADDLDRTNPAEATGAQADTNANDDAWLANAEPITAPGRRGYRAFDSHGQAYSIQESSTASEECLWLGLDDADPVIEAPLARQLGIPTSKTVGMVPYPIPKDVILSTRMHLTQTQVKELLPTLQHFATTGRLPAAPDTKTEND
ncbi:MAG: Uncharacterized protein AWU57_461 [Marinobacter sp. T13-3]|nr:MAG: Uncharacterized protein AWU57_461 [Marinobacter sp. T13-3]